MHDATSTPLTRPTSGAGASSASGGATSRSASPVGRPTHEGGSRPASEGLTPISPASASSLDHRRLGGDRARHEQLAVDAAHEEEVDRSGRDSDRHAQRDPGAPHTDSPDPLDRLLHLPCRACGSLLVAGALEEEQHRVAAPLEQAGAPAVRLVEQRGEDRIERIAKELRTDLSSPVEALRERREARDVDERERALDCSMLRVWHVAQPLDLEPWNIRLQHLVLIVERGSIPATATSMHRLVEVTVR